MDAIKRGDTIWVNDIEGYVILASENGRSLAVELDGALHTRSGGMLIGFVALFQQGDGSWIEIVEGTPVDVFRGEYDFSKGGRKNTK